MSTLDNLRKEAKRWLAQVRRNNPGLQKRLRLAYPNAPQHPSLRDVQHALALEHGYASWVELKAAVTRTHGAAGDGSSRSRGTDVVDDFLRFACWDHRVSGRGDYATIEAAAMRLLEKHPDLPRANLYTAVVCGAIAEVERILAARPELANTRGGARNWEPILYLCHARLPLPMIGANCEAIARALLDRGASPNAYYMAGDALYSTLVGVAGEGEQDAPPHPQRETLYGLLLERGAEPYDIQVLYNTGFRGDILWWLELTYAHTVRTGRAADWRDPDWPMLDMGGYGSGARFCLATAIRRNDIALARWLLEHGANPNAAPPPAPAFSKRSLYEDAVRDGCEEIAQLLLQHGATPRAPVTDDEDAFIAAALRLDRAAARALLDRHPEYLRSHKALFAAAERDRADVVGLLLDLGVPIEIEDALRQRALHIAAGHGAVRVAELLIERGAEIDPRESRWGASPIGYAAHRDDRAMIDLLSRFSRSVATLARAGKVARLRDVLNADPALARDTFDDGETLLWWLPRDDETAREVAGLLLAHGADPAARAKDGATAADVARRRGLDEAARLLENTAQARRQTPPD